MVQAKTSNRQAEIISVTLDLLAETPLASLTTRQIAKQLSISQPALFRHFRSKEQLLLAVMHSARDELSDIAESVLQQEQEPLARLEKLATGLIEHVSKHPGLARLLFSPPAPGALRDALRQLVSMQRALVSQLVEDGQSLGLFRRTMKPSEAATFFVGMLQGIVLRAQLSDEYEARAEVKPMLRLWLNGARADPGDAKIETKQPSLPLQTMFSLDVRPLLKEGSDPLRIILNSLKTVRKGGVLSVKAPFLPIPLIHLLDEKGHKVYSRQCNSKLWSIDIVVGGNMSEADSKPGEIEDLRELETPEPLERVLLALTSLEPGACYIARLPRFPRLLLPHLERHNVVYEILKSDDGSALLHIEKPS